MAVVKERTVTRPSPVTGVPERVSIIEPTADPGYQAFWILRLGFTLAPIIAGVDKFFNVLVDWDRYLAPWAINLFGSAPGFMAFVGVVEIIAGIGVAVFPRVFAYVVCAWLLAIVINLLSYPGYYDIALRDFGLALGALALGRLSAVYGRLERERRAAAVAS